MNDVYEYIINFVDEEDIMNMLSVNKRFYDEKILLRIMNKRFPYLSIFKKPFENWRLFYNKMIFSIINLKQLGIPYICHKKFNPYEFFSKNKYDYDLFLKYSIEIKDFKTMEILIQKTSEHRLALKAAIKLEDFHIINKLTLRKYDYNYVFLEVVKTGNMEIINFFLNSGVENFNAGLIGSVYTNNIDIVKFMIHKGANNIDDALRTALELNKLDMINFFIDNFNNYNVNDCFEAASEGGNLEMVKFMIHKGAKNFYRSLKIAFRKNHIHIVNYL